MAAKPKNFADEDELGTVAGMPAHRTPRNASGAKQRQVAQQPRTGLASVHLNIGINALLRTDRYSRCIRASHYRFAEASVDRGEQGQRIAWAATENARTGGRRHPRGRL
jgi:hypothetical protein